LVTPPNQQKIEMEKLYISKRKKYEKSIRDTQYILAG
jgi:hypothetical protein